MTERLLGQIFKNGEVWRMEERLRTMPFECGRRHKFGNYRQFTEDEGLKYES